MDGVDLQPQYFGADLPGRRCGCVSLTSVGGASSLTLTYDPLGRLSSYQAGSTTTQFLYDGTNLIGEYVGGSITRRYMHALGTDHPFVQFNGVGVAATDATWLYTNYQGSIIALADNSGNKTQLIKYGPYGEPLGETNFASWTGHPLRLYRPDFPAGRLSILLQGPGL